MKITEIRRVKKQKRVDVYLDGKPAFRVGCGNAASAGLEVGQALTESQLKELAAADEQERCLGAASRLLSYRPRSEHELRVRLERRNFGAATVDRVISLLREKGLVDDAAFARFWMDQRQTFRPCSLGLTRLELSRKGVGRDVIDELQTETDDASAYQAGLSYIRRLPRDDYPAFRKRLGGFLTRRGFSYETINTIINKLWNERE